MSVNTAIVVDKCPEIMANHIRILEEMGLVNVYGAGCMEVADAIFRANLDKNLLIFIELMLPKSEQDLARTLELRIEREPAYTQWLETDAISGPDQDSISPARWKVQRLDEEILALTELEGAITLVESWAQEFGDAGRLNSRVVYTTTRVNAGLESRGRTCVHPGWAEWLSKPADQEKVVRIISKVLGA